MYGNFLNGSPINSLHLGNPEKLELILNTVSKIFGRTINIEEIIM